MSVARTLPSASVLASTILRTREGAELVAGSLWSAQPLAVLILRRPGCVLCRDEAQRLWALKPEFDKIGVGLVCIVHEWIPREINAFSPSFWPGPVFHDHTKAFYAALNGGGKPLRGSIWGLINPWSNVWRRIRTAQQTVKEHNLVGDGLTMGGALVIRPGRGAASATQGQGAGGSDGGDGVVTWMHVEKELGLVADPQAVLEAARQAAASTGQAAAGSTAAAGTGSNAG